VDGSVAIDACCPKEQWLEYGQDNPWDYVVHDSVLILRWSSADTGSTVLCEAKWSLPTKEIMALYDKYQLLQ
jgi:hypothetical protein